MDTTYLGRTGLSVSRLCLGTMNFGDRTEEAPSMAIMDRALDEGINFFDTANRYGGTKGLGITESLIGRWFARGGGRREKVVLATKVYGPMGEDPGPNDRGCSARHIKLEVENSLRRLQTDTIDLYQMHHIDRNTPWEEVWQAMEQLVQEGKVLYVGSSNFAGWHIAQANEAAARRKFLGLVSEQSIYNLAARQIELDVIPACQAYGVGIIPWSPLRGGLLGGVLNVTDGNRRAGEHMQQTIEERRPQLERWEAFCDDLGEAPATVALAWLLHQPAVTAPIVGPRTMAQLEDSFRALEVTLNEDQLAALDDIWPGYKPAPEHYAW